MLLHKQQCASMQKERFRTLLRPIKIEFKCESHKSVPAVESLCTLSRSHKIL
ncbi:hypothetical protein KC19_1G196200 [Ceratodon purpureus]|uniref:Uncharacterized protein n=1 Tax=Ceratodon purpureus TaxID=3225 RepID=A0A8T0JAG7_CERPU|nr:hypothetical protein KC19_1G196200 [Ceratodon purpureus]